MVPRAVMRPVLAAVVGLLIVLACACGHAGPPAELWHRWLAHDPDSTLRIDHDEWDAILMRYLRIGEDGVHRVAYGEVTPADRTRLDDYIERMAGLPISAYNRTEQLAFWINLYKALVVRLIVDHYPIASIRDIGTPTAAGAAGPWGQELVVVEGSPISLHDIQHRILRPIWRDPRIHYALSCGAVSCPNLQPEPFYGDQLERHRYQRDQGGPEHRDHGVGGEREAPAGVGEPQPAGTDLSGEVRVKREAVEHRLQHPCLGTPGDRRPHGFDRAARPLGEQLEAAR